MGLIDVCFWEPLIQSYLMYGTGNNFTGKPLYNSKLTKAWLHPRAAKMLIRAHDLLKKERPDLSLLIYDAARPIEVQRKMSEWARKTNNEYYVANSTIGGLHNYGMAVDVTLVNENGEWLPMGTPFDFFGPESHTDKEDVLLKKHRISPSEYKNRRFLRRIMKEAGFRAVESEWWHFNACSRNEAREKYVLIDR
jgi:D-alanyl-D-alanine dipeptidase